MSSYSIPLLLGFFIKFFDDSVDLYLNIPSFYLELSKSMIILLSVLLIKENVILAFIVLLSLLVSNYCKKFDDDFWYSYLYVIIFLSLYFNQDIIKVLTNDKIYYKLAFILFIPLMIYFEEKSFIEEKSNNKTTVRIYNILGNSLAICYLEYYNYIELLDIDFFVKLLFFINSYFLTNIIIQNVLFEQLQPAQNILKKKDKTPKNKNKIKNKIKTK